MGVRYTGRDSAARCPCSPLYCYVSECVLAVPVRPWCRRWCWRWCGLDLGRTNINTTIHHPLKTRAALIHPQRWITRVECQAIRCRKMGEGGTAVILQWTEP